MQNKLNIIKNKIIITICLFASCFNIKFGYFGFADFAIFASLVMVLFGAKKLIIPKFPVVFVFFLISLLVFGAASNGDINYSRVNIFLGFLYKYLFIVLAIILARNLYIDVNHLVGSIFICWCILSLWILVFSSIYLIYLGVNDFVLATQVGFPGTLNNEDSDTDSHLLGFVYGFFTMWLFLTLKSNVGKIFVISIGLISLIVIGSRNPLFLGLFSTMFFLVLRSENKFEIMVFLVFILISLLIYNNLFVVDNEFRAFEFSYHDDSFVSRLRKFEDSFNEYVAGNLIFGITPLRSSHIWYDGIHAQFINNFGFFALVILFILFVKILNTFKLFNKKTDYLIYSPLVLYVFLGQFITEFLLTSRGVALVIFPLALIYYSSFNQEITTRKF